MSLHQLKWATHKLTTHAFYPGTTQNHIHQASSFIQFCDINSYSSSTTSSSTLCYYITHLTHQFQSAKLDLQDQVPLQAALPDPGSHWFISQHLPPSSCGHHHENPATQMTPNPPSSSTSALSPHLQPWAAEILHVSVPSIWVLCHAQAEQPGTHHTCHVRPILAHLLRTGLNWNEAWHVIYDWKGLPLGSKVWYNIQ